MTETCATVTMETLDANAIGSVGIPLANCNIKIIDPDSGNELPYNSPGEVCVSTPGLMKGYYDNQQATNDVIEIVNGEKWLHTGDVGIISDDGLLIITGRIKRIITRREGNVYHKVFPVLIESKLAKINGVKEIAIVGRPDDKAGSVPVAYVVPNYKGNFDELKKELVSFCFAELDKYEYPVDFICVEEIPRTMLGKVNYLFLEELAREGHHKENNSGIQ